MGSQAFYVYKVACDSSILASQFAAHFLSKPLPHASKMFHNMANITFEELASTLMPSTAFLEQVSVHTVAIDKFSFAFQNVLQYFTWSSLWKILILISIAVNFKNFPLVYHLRILNGVRFVLKSQRSTLPLTPDHLFQPLITSSKATLMETDVFGHKSNSTYFSDVDISRTHLVTTLFSKAIEDIRGSTTMNGLSGKPRSLFTIPLGAVSCCFRRELKPYETYDMWTRILSWDEKWIYLVTHFVKKGAKVHPEHYSLYPQQNSVSSSSDGSRKNSTANIDQRASKNLTTTGSNPGIAASALSKIVFKKDRHTIRPESMLEQAGLLPKKDAVTATESVKGNTIEESPKPSNISSDDITNVGLPEVLQSCSTTSWWTRERIEAERQRGMNLAMLLAAQSQLEHELNEDVALGRHYDGHGFEGVVATLAQLGGISNYQLL